MDLVSLRWEERLRSCSLPTQDLESLQWQYREQGERTVRFERDFQALKVDTMNQGAELRRCEDENRNLQQTLQSLHLDAASAHQDYKVALAQLEQEVAQLERDLADSRRTCAQKDQVVLSLSSQLVVFLYHSER